MNVQKATFYQTTPTSRTGFFLQKKSLHPAKSGFFALILLFCVSFFGSPAHLSAQPADFTARDPLAGIAKDNWLKPDSTFNKKRFYLSAGTGAALYGAASVGLYKTWYADFGRTGLRSFNDWPEWSQMDKAGHAFTAYMFSRYAFAGLRWSGMKRPAARYAAFGVANLLQGTIEIMDGFSEGWGFSWSDMGANVSGSLLFTIQDAVWHEQRILMKVSNDLRPIPDVPVFSANGAEGNLGYVVEDRFGTNVFERYLKDYNAQTIWVSANPKAFFPESKIPVWLNVAVGYGAENVYGAYGNTWQENGQRFRYAPERYRQWFLSPDIYFSRIPTKKRWVRLTLGILDFVKFPSPALEYSQGKLKGHWIMW
ncbi:DUF2279 domain-containing protein [Neolewinella aurantiaca]|uniref:DUF2279 domain-containing protein n=1 Tax=Neolewinella aurantiaca TaxID=2602767 RepID=A0A5C7FT17_9BACT|nr:DUF2279 domain-containing protein [Neolewinella aurantiaca]TXF87883.1 DUF2279 domain-containing protein [Neolewinella aurantiaca]